MLEFRPHHFLCTLGFEGKGYSDQFVQNFSRIATALRASDASGDQVTIQVVDASDAICKPCPNRVGSKCQSEKKISELDDAHAKILGLQPGDRLTWGEAKSRLAEKMSEESFEKACAPCSWKSLGLCKSALQLLKTSALAILLLHPLVSQSKEVKQPDLLAKLPVDTLEEQLLKSGKSKKAQSLKKAYEALKSKKYPQARSLAESVLSDEMFGDYSYWINAQSYLAEATEAYQAKKFQAALELSKKAIAQTQKLASNYPYSPFMKHSEKDIGIAELASGDALAQNKSWKQARTMFERGFQRLAAHNVLTENVRSEEIKNYSEACLKKAKREQDDLCFSWLIRFVNSSPRGSEDIKAIAKFFPDLGEKAKPPQPVGRATQTYKAPDLDQVAFDAALALFLGEKTKESIEAFRKFLDDFPKSTHRFRARYWLAQGLTQHKDDEQAKKIYEELQQDSPLSFYGLLAAMANGKIPDNSITLDLPSATMRDPNLLPYELFRLKRAEHFVAEKAYELAAYELKDMRPRDPLSGSYLTYLATLSYLAKSYNTAFVILGDLIQRKHEGVFSTHTLRMVFPVEYLELVQKYSTENHLDPILVLSLIKQESSFETGVYSPVGAIGLMQLMFSTAVDTSPEVSRMDLLQAETNIRVGTKHLKRLMTKFNGNIVLSLAGYNAGPAATDRWIREAPAKRGMLEFIESIPYKETREYVSGIIRNYYWYSRSLNGEGPKSLSYFWNMYGPPEQPAGLQVRQDPKSTLKPLN